jgi:hypothetical protein
LFSFAGWIDVTWDAGGSNSYRMGAEGKYDLQLALSHDPDKLKPLSKEGATGGVKTKPNNPQATDSVKKVMIL